MFLKKSKDKSSTDEQKKLAAAIGTATGKIVAIHMDNVVKKNRENKRKKEEEA